jgi:hypothetical protein
MARIWQSAFSIDFALLDGSGTLKRQMKKAPQVGLEPTTLRLTATQPVGNDKESRVAKEIAEVF